MCVAPAFGLQILREDRLEELVPVGDMSENLDEQKEWIMPENAYSDRSGDIIDEAMNIQNAYGHMEKELFVMVIF